MSAAAGPWEEHLLKISRAIRDGRAEAWPRRPRSGLPGWSADPRDEELVERFVRGALERQGGHGAVRDTPAARWLLGLMAIPGFAAQFKRVPAAYFELGVERVDDAEVRLASVQCPCKATPPIVEEGHVRHCDCERSYLHLEGRVYVAFGPKQTEIDRCEAVGYD